MQRSRDTNQGRLDCRSSVLTLSYPATWIIHQQFWCSLRITVPRQQPKFSSLLLHQAKMIKNLSDGVAQWKCTRPALETSRVQEPAPSLSFEIFLNVSSGLQTRVMICLKNVFNQTMPIILYSQNSVLFRTIFEVW